MCGKLSAVKEHVCIQGGIKFLETVIEPQKLAKVDVKKMPITGLSFTALQGIYNPVACVLCALE
jgi:hypothetical protein